MIFTEAACGYIKKMLEKDGSKGLRISIKKTGCSGYSYVPTLVKEVNAQDIPFQAAPDVMIYIDSQWQDLLHDVQVDYVEEEKTGLKQKRLVFTNPKEAGRCGCGESFNIE